MRTDPTMLFAGALLLLTFGCEPARGPRGEPARGTHVAGTAHAALAHTAPSASTASAARFMDPTRVASLAETVAELRGHAFKKPPPPVRFVPRNEVSQLAGADALSAKIDVRGRYVEDRNEIIIAEDFETSPDLDSILVHELVHALLTDYGVRGRPFLIDADPKQRFARSALVEGDANLVEAGFRAQREGLHPKRTMASLTRIHAPFVPLTCRGDLDPTNCSLANAIYEDGRVFASSLYRIGGTALLDAAYAAPPTTALEVLYPDLYLAGIKEHSLETELTAALAVEGVTPKAHEHLDALRLAHLFAADVAAEILRTTLHDLRADAVATVDGGGRIVLTEWADDASATKLVAALGTKTASLVGPRRVVIGVGIARERVEAIAKRVSPKGTFEVSPLPFGRRMAPGPVTWEEELADGLRKDGPKGFRLIGIDAGRALRAGGPSGTSSLWLSPKGEKVFLLPTTAPVLSRKLLIQTIEKAWADPVEGFNDPELPEEKLMPIGLVRLSLAPIGTPSILLIAIARVPVCRDDAAALIALQFGADASVKASLAKNLELLRPSAEADPLATVCTRLKTESTELTPPAP